MICSDCQREVESGRVRCPCGALVGHVARRPAQEQFADNAHPAPVKRARIAQILSDAVDTIDHPRRDPVEHWKSVLNTPGLPDISYRYAQEALAIIDRPSRRKARERQPGEDDEEIA